MTPPRTLAVVPTTDPDPHPQVAAAPQGPTTLSRLAGKRVVVLNWRDVHHPQAGGAEMYMHRIAVRWAQAGANVVWLTAAVPGRPAREVVDGVTVVRAGGALSVYARTAIALRRVVGEFDYLVDCQNGIPFFAPLFVDRAKPVVQVVHHIHQEQFATRFGPVMAAVGRFLEGPVSRAVYRGRPVVAVSPSTREGVRRRLRMRGPIHVVPNGLDATPPIRAPRDPDPTIAVVSRLVPHKRVDLLLGQLVPVAQAVPRLRVDIVGNGPERARLQGLAAGELLCRGPYTLRGYFRAPEHNARAFTPDGFYRSGDLMWRHPSGNYVVAGRTKDLINRGGEKISAEEVENLILGHPAVQDVACIPVPDDVLGERVCACIVPRAQAPTLDELVAFLRQHEIAAFKLPERLEVLDAFPLSPVGKVSKRDLVARFS